MDAKRNITYNLFWECFYANECQTQQSSDNSDHIDSDREGNELEESPVDSEKKNLPKKREEDQDQDMSVLFKEPINDDVFGHSIALTLKSILDTRTKNL